MFRAHVARLDAELLERVGEREGEIKIAKAVHVLAAVERVAEIVVPRTVHGELLLSARVVRICEGGIPRVVGDSRNDSRRQQRQVRSVTAVERQFDYPARIDRLLERRRARL